MKPPEKKDPGSAQFEESELLRLELMVARRADRLWRRKGHSRGSDLMHWMKAEAEVFGRFFAPGRRMQARVGAGR